VVHGDLQQGVQGELAVSLTVLDAADPLSKVRNVVGLPVELVVQRPVGCEHLCTDDCGQLFPRNRTSQ